MNLRIRILFAPAVILAGAIGSPAAMSAVTWDVDQDESPAAEAPVNGRPSGIPLLEASLPQALAEIQAQGFASNLPVGVIVRQIVPPEVTVEIDPSVRNRKTSWKGGKPWRESLADALKPAGLEARLVAGIVAIGPAGSAHFGGNAGGKPVDLKRGGATAETPATQPAPAAVPVPAADKPAADKPTEVVSAASIPVTAMQIWQVEPRMTLRSLLEEWAAKAGWSVAWQSEYDFRIEAKASFSGSFQEASSQLIRSFGQSSPRIKATYWGGNKVVVVEMASDSVAP